MTVLSGTINPAPGDVPRGGTLSRVSLWGTSPNYLTILFSLHRFLCVFVGLFGGGHVVLGPDRQALLDRLEERLEPSQAQNLDDGADDGRIDDGSGQGPELVLDGDARGIDRRHLEFRWELERGRVLLAVDDDDSAFLEAFGHVDGLDERRVHHDDMVGLIDAALVVNGLIIDPNEGKDGGSPPLHSELRIGLDVIALFSQRVGQD